MKFDLIRSVPTKFTQPGDLFIGDELQAHTLETGTIFTPGQYELKNCYSALVHMWLTGIFSLGKESHLLGFIHSGQPHHLAARHIMLGYERRLDLILDSRKAAKRIYELVDDARTSFDETVILEIRA